MNSYYCHFSIRNGAETIRPTLDSILNQTIRPKKIVVVQDGSIDETAKILDEYSNSNKDLFEIISTNNKTIDFSRLPKFWNMCLREGYDYQFIIADDVVFPNDYCERLIHEMELDPQLVIASGNYFNKIPNSDMTPSGAGRMIKESFFKNLGGKYYEKVGYESWILFEALKIGCRIKNFKDLKFSHLKPLGRTHAFSEFAPSMRALGYDPLMVIGRCIRNLIYLHEMPRRSTIRVLIDYIKPLGNDGYISPYPEEFRKFVKQYQRARIRRFIRRYFLGMKS